MTNETQKEIASVELDQVMSVDPTTATKRVAVITDDDGNPRAGFVIVGKDSKQYRDCQARLRSSGIRRQANKKTKIDTKTEEGALAFGKLMEDTEYETAVAVVVDYFGFANKGVPLELSEKQTRAFFDKFPSWREKVSQELENDEAFLNLSLANSVILRAVNSDSQE